MSRFMQAAGAVALMAALVGTPSAWAQGEGKDDTGTNPVNFTWDWRTYTEMQAIDGDNSVTLQTIDQRIPLGKKASIRFRVKHLALSLDPESDGMSTEISGLGDWDARVIFVPTAGPRGALAFGLEGTFDTASNRSLGSGKTTLGPQVFGVLFKPPGGGALMAPAYQYVFHVAGDDDRADISRSAFDLFYLWLDKDKKWWVMANPQAVIDHEGKKEFALFEAEYGRMMFAGLSSYVRPSLGIGADRPYEWSAELGLKVIYR